MRRKLESASQPAVGTSTLRVAVSFAAVSFAIVLCLLILAAPARSQGFSNASKSMDIAPFAGFLANYTAIKDLSGNTHIDSGLAFGIDITKYFGRFPVAPSFEGRVNLASGTVASEKTYVFGLKLQSVPVFFRARPYIDFLVGPGTVHYGTSQGFGLLGDNSTVYSYGAGIDFDLVGPFRLKIDGQYQKWKLGTGENITPATGIIGVSYKLPFRPHFRHDDQ